MIHRAKSLVFAVGLTVVVRKKNEENNMGSPTNNNMKRGILNGFPNNFQTSYHGPVKRKEEPEDGYWKHTMTNMGQELGVSGLRYASSKDEPMARRIIWIVLILTGLGFMSYQLVDSVLQYYTRPVSVAVDDVYPHSLKFPVLTICNENQFVRSKARALGIESAMQDLFPPWQDPAHPVYPNYTAINIDIQNAYTQHGFTSQEDFERNISNTAQEMLYGCSFSSAACNASDFIELFTDAGYCFQFNPKREVYRAGQPYGLTVHLDIKQAEYLALLEVGAGVRVKVTAPGIPPMTTHDAIRLMPGTISNIKLSERSTIRLEPPYGNCSRSVTLKRYSTYTLGNCKDECLLDYVGDQCGCIPIAFKLPSDRACTLIETYTCAWGQFYYYVKNNLGETCSCELECETTIYDMSVTTTQYADYMMNFISANLTGGNWTVQDMKTNMVSFNMYFPSLSFLRMESQIAYGTTMLFNDLGGALGLMLGSTFFTIYEIFDIIIWAGIVKCKKNKRVQSGQHQDTPAHPPPAKVQI